MKEVVYGITEELINKFVKKVHKDLLSLGFVTGGIVEEGKQPVFAGVTAQEAESKFIHPNDFEAWRKNVAKETIKRHEIEMNYYEALEGWTTLNIDDLPERFFTRDDIEIRRKQESGWELQYVNIPSRAYAVINIDNGMEHQYRCNNEELVKDHNKTSNYIDKWIELKINNIPSDMYTTKEIEMQHFDTLEGKWMDCKNFSEWNIPQRSTLMTLFTNGQKYRYRLKPIESIRITETDKNDLIEAMHVLWKLSLGCNAENENVVEIYNNLKNIINRI